MNNKVVYIHRKKSDDTIFYVGMGNPDRPKSKERSVVWHRTVKKHGYYIEVLLTDLSKEDACEIEIYLIEKLGRRDKSKGMLVNLTDGGELGNGRISNLGKACYNIETGEIYTTLAKGAKSAGLPQSTVSEQLNGSKTIPKYNVIRSFNNPYPENTRFWTEVKENETYIDDSFDVIDNVSDFEVDETDAVYIERFNELPKRQQELIFESYYYSLREVADKFNLHYSYVHTQIKKGIKYILRDDYYKYKNSRNRN